MSEPVVAAVWSSVPPTEPLPLDIADWPQLGDEVLFRDDERWVSAVVEDRHHPKGAPAPVLKLRLGEDTTVTNAKHHRGTYGWMTYAEMARQPSG